MFTIIGKITALLISPAEILKILKGALTLISALSIIAGVIGLIITVMPKSIKVKVSEAFIQPITQPIKIALAIAGGFVGVLIIREMRAFQPRQLT